MNKWSIRICQGVNCKNYLSDDLFAHAKKIVGDNPDIEVEKRGCMSRCDLAPNIQIINEETGESKIIHNVKHEDVEDILSNL